MFDFFTIKENEKSELTEKKSRFICNLFYVETKEEAENKIKEIKSKYFDAKHNCFAYRIYENNGILEKTSDDGEPSGTAGSPMLNVLQKNNFCNVIAIVTRYFGGILLGTGGLTRAYLDVTKNTLKIAKIQEKCLGEEIIVNLDYNNLDSFKYYCKNNNINIINVQYLENIVCKIQVEEEKISKFLEDFEAKKIKVNKIDVLSKKIINKCK